METRIERIDAALRAAFSPTMLEVVDDSHRHAGHAGVAAMKEGSAPVQGETHYSALVVSEQFCGVSRVDRTRAVNAVLAAEYSQGLHALSLRLLTPQEHTNVTTD